MKIVWKFYIASMALVFSGILLATYWGTTFLPSFLTMFGMGLMPGSISRKAPGE